MNLQLDNYVKVYSNLISSSFCTEVIKELEEDYWTPHFFYNAVENKSSQLSGDKELDISFGQNLSDKNRKIFINAVTKSLETYMSDLNMSWYKGWAGFSSIRFNRYENNKLMARHFDGINSLFDGTRKGIPTLSIVGNLNENYVGGDFIMFDDQKIPLKQGDIMIFPSTFLYPHHVLPVTAGTRYSFVSWVW